MPSALASRTMGALRRIKLATLGAAEQFGVFDLAARTTWRNRRLLILCYHGVSLHDEHEACDEHVSADHLRSRFELLRDEGCTVLPLAIGVERLYRGDLPPRSVVLTFDDGLYDFKARAYPLLREFGYHATLYAATYYCTVQRPVFDIAAYYLLWKGRGRTLSLAGITTERRKVTIPTTRLGIRALAGRIRAHANERALSAEEKHVLLGELCARLGFDWEAFVGSRMYQLLTPDELSSLHAGTVDVQLHTHRHRTPRDGKLFVREIDDNRTALERMGLSREGRRHFCYPSGDVDARFIPWLRACGVSTATTCEPQIADAHSDPLLLPRVIDTMGMTQTEFRSWLSGISALVPQRARA
jgi:peptidoglycan/xylan/chitin deacetylase (PgdA/CDA1 family)